MQANDISEALSPRLENWLMMPQNGIWTVSNFWQMENRFGLHIESLKLNYAIRLNSSWGLEIIRLGFGKVHTEDPKRKERKGRKEGKHGTEWKFPFYFQPYNVFFASFPSIC